MVDRARPARGGGRGKGKFRTPRRQPQLAKPVRVSFAESIDALGESAEPEPLFAIELLAPIEQFALTLLHPLVLPLILPACADPEPFDAKQRQPEHLPQHEHLPRLPRPEQRTVEVVALLDPPHDEYGCAADDVEQLGLEFPHTLVRLHRTLHTDDAGRLVRPFDPRVPRPPLRG